MQIDTSNEELIYGFDPLCGWCFAFGPSIRAIVAANPHLPVRVKTGGLVVGERVAPIAESRAYLIQGLEQVRRAAGVVAGEGFYRGLLAEGSYISDSEPPCRAIYAVEQLDPAAVFAFADSLPTAFYGRGLPLDDAEVLGDLAAAQGVDREAFVALWQSDAARRGTQEAFRQARAAGVVSYPTLLYRRAEEVTPVARGFLRPEEAVAAVQRLRVTYSKQQVY